MNFDPQFDTDAFSKVHEAFYNLCDAEKALKKARRRALVVRAAQSTVLLVGTAVICHHIKKD